MKTIPSLKVNERNFIFPGLKHCQSCGPGPLPTQYSMLGLWPESGCWEQTSAGQILWEFKWSGLGVPCQESLSCDCLTHAIGVPGKQEGDFCMYSVLEICGIHSNFEVIFICVTAPRVLVPSHCSQVEAFSFWPAETRYRPASSESSRKLLIQPLQTLHFRIVQI